MKIIVLLATILLALLSNVSHVNSQYEKSYVLPQMPSYVILAPKQVRPSTFYQASISIIKLLYPSFTVRMTVSRDKVEFGHETMTFKSEGTQIMRVEIPARASADGQYSLEVMGSITENSAIIFTNTTKLNFIAREFSVFIQMSKPIYHQGQTVQFRVIPVQQNLMPKFGTVSKIQVYDANGFVVKRWLNPTTNIGGIYELQFPLADQITEGIWKVEFDAEKWKATETFEVREFWLPRFDVNVTLPVRLSEQGFGIFGIIQANKTSGMPVSGNCSITIQVRDPTLDRFKTPPLLEIIRNIEYFDGKADFLFSMSELKDLKSQQSLANKDVWVNATVFDRLTLIHRTGWAYSFIYSDLTKIKIFGGDARPYKPGMPFTAYLAVYQPDGTPVKIINNRNVDLEIKCDGSRVTYSHKGLIVPDSGIIKHTLTMNEEDCLFLDLRAVYAEVGGRELSSFSQKLFQYRSLSKQYIQISLATDNPRVNEFAVFHLRMSYPTHKIYYQVVAGGNIVYVDTIVLTKAVKTRTFSLAMSREMAPMARLIAYYIKNDGEIIADSLSYFVNITNLNNVQVSINRGKDLNVDTLEINGYAQPGSYLALNVLHYDLYRRGAKNILRDYNIIDSLMEYETKTQQPYQHDWYYDLEYIDRSYVPAPSAGVDTNSTFDNAGLVIFTDAPFHKVNFFHDCNGTADPSQEFPCYATAGRRCYSREQRCNGKADCPTWADEAGCPEQNIIKPEEKAKDMMLNFDMLYRDWNDGAWLWKTYWVKPNGRINFRVDLPKMDTSWVVGAFAIDRLQGFSIIERPAVFSGIRRFYMVVEAPEESFYGEQIGVRITLFNYWDYWTEALMEVKKSDQYKVVQVEDYGRVNSFNPKTIKNQAIHTLVYLSAGEARYIFLPIIPNGPGNSTIHICAYTFIGSNCESREFRVTMNGVANYYHTSNLIDLTSKTNIFTWNFKIPLRQSYYEPEQRNLRFVPDSKLAKVSVTGDIFGPTPSDKMPFFTTYDGLRLSHGAAENVFFEFGFNIQLLKYLRRDLTSDMKITVRALDYCNRVLQDCLSYYDPKSGGFANFREYRNKPNILATAFAVWNLNSVTSGLSDWDRYIYIPTNLVQSSINFLSRMQVTSGTFRGSFEYSDILDSKFIPTHFASNLTADQIEAQKRLPVTAMVIVALNEGRTDKSTYIINEASNFVRQHLLLSTDVFTQLIGTYSLIHDSSSGSVVTSMIKTIQSNAQANSETKYFSNTKVREQDMDQNNAGQLMMYPRNEWPNDGYTVASSALGMLILNIKEIWSESDINNINMIQFLSKMRNHPNGFASTFDSMLAVRALNLFSQSDRNRRWYKLLVTQTMTSDASWEKTFFIENYNYSVGNYTTIPNDNVWGEIEFKTQGTGRVLVQLDTSSRHFDLVRLKNPLNPDNTDVFLKSFNIHCTPTFSGKNSSIMHMQICGNWIGNTGPLSKPEAGMTIFDVSLPTGYVVLNDDLRRYVESGDVPTLRYARFWPGKVNFYLDNLKSTNTCVSFRADRYFPIANITREQLCSVYEYYEPGRYYRSIYTVQALYTNHICNVFGSYQCPYSPFFNGAPASTILYSTLVIVVLVTMFLYSLLFERF